MVNKRNVRRARAKENESLGPLVHELRTRVQFLEGLLIMATLRYIPLKFTLADRKQLIGESKDYMYVSDTGVSEDGTWYFNVTKKMVDGKPEPSKLDVTHRN